MTEKPHLDRRAECAIAELLECVAEQFRDGDALVVFADGSVGWLRTLQENWKPAYQAEKEAAEERCRAMEQRLNEVIREGKHETNS